MTMAPRLTLLYVDDDRINTLLFVETCRPDARLEVLTAANGTDALLLAREQALDVLVIDLHLPDTDGLQLLRQLRELPHLAHTPAFLCTAERIEEARDPATRAGFVGVWIKPVELDAVVHDILRVQAGPAGARHPEARSALS
jgi:two-component system, OmpR family, response regulator